MSKVIISVLLMSVSFTVFAATPDFKCTGFATCDGSTGQMLTGGTTGGAGGKVVTVTTTEDLQKYIGVPEPYIIYISGTINLPAPKQDFAMYEISSNKSIIGLGSDAKITDGGFRIGPLIDNAVTSPPANVTKNIIIRNITFVGNLANGDDCINVQMFAHHVWIDHCDFSSQKDGLVDIKRGSDWVTVSWNHFHDHKKTCLVGRDDADDAQDEGHLHVTFHHNWFDGTEMRHPRVRYGWVHVANNYYNNIDDYGIGVDTKAQVVSEKNYFENLEDCSQIYNTSGYLKDIGSFRDSLTTEAFELNPCGVTWEPSRFYLYQADDALSTKAVVMANCGVGKIDNTGVQQQSRKQWSFIKINNAITSYTVLGAKIPGSSIVANTVSSQVRLIKTRDVEGVKAIVVK